MKGFFSFVVLLSLVLVIIHSFSYNQLSKNFDSSTLISLERIYQLEMNLKESLLEGVRQGSIEAIQIYLLTTEPSSFNLEEAKYYVKLYSYEKILSLDEMNFEDFEFFFWCGNPTEYELKKLRKEILIFQELLLCSNCHSLDNYNCIDYLDVDFILDVEEDQLPELNSISIGNKNGFFGVSIYSKKFGLSSVFLIPKQEVSLIE